MQVLPNLFLSIFSRTETSKIFTSSSHSFSAYNSSKDITPEKTRRSEYLYANTNIAASKKKPLQHLKDLLANKKMVKSILHNKEKSAKSKNTEKEIDRVAFLANFHVMKFAIYYKLSFQVQGSSKPT